jgi:hypothetical protein
MRPLEEFNETIRDTPLAAQTKEHWAIDRVEGGSEVDESAKQWKVCGACSLFQFIEGEEVHGHVVRFPVCSLAGEDERVECCTDAVQHHLVDQLQHHWEEDDWPVICRVSGVALLFEDRHERPGDEEVR